MAWTFEHSEHTKGSRQDVWAHWADVPAWPVWDSAVKEAVLDGEFKVGSAGSLQPVSGPKAKFELVEVTPSESFVSQTKLPLAAMSFEHRLSEDEGGLLITHRAVITGLTTPLFALVIGRDIAKHLPGAVKALAELAGAGKPAS